MPVDALDDCRMAKRRPPLTSVGEALCPAAPTCLDDTGVPTGLIGDLVLKLVHLVPQFTTEWVSDRACLPRSVAADILEQLMVDRLVEVIGRDGALSYRWAASERGRLRAAQLLEVSGYAGPAPVAADAYAALIDWQCDHMPQVLPSDIRDASASLILPANVTEIAGLAAMSRRSLFLYGPPGNGKTTIGHLLHAAMRGELWIPHSIAIGNDIVRLYDPQIHVECPVDAAGADGHRIDRRWVRVRRPFVVAAGELQLSDLDLAYSQALGYYEAPLHMKANGGLFLLDDLGYQRANPFQLLNRWVFPLEHRIDFLTLKSGQKLFVPFRQMLVISTNLDPESVMEPAILRRVGYRLLMPDPEPDRYREILTRQAESMGVEIDYELVEHLIARHQQEDRPMRGCVPRDLLHRVRDVCRYRGLPLQITTELLDLAWAGYYGQGPCDGPERWG